MKLNPDCIRSILLTLEEHTGFIPAVEISEDNFMEFPLLTEYTYTEIVYHINQCDYDGYFIECVRRIDESFLIFDISPKAHKFLSDIRSESNWNAIKAKAKEIGSNSLPVLTQIATKYLMSKIG